MLHPYYLVRYMQIPYRVFSAFMIVCALLCIWYHIAAERAPAHLLRGARRTAHHGG